MSLPGIEFDSPLFLALLAIVPAVWWFTFRSLAGLGPVRRVLALLLRSVVLIVLVLAAAELQWVQTSRRLTVIYLLDQSKSIPAAQRAAMIRYVNAAIVRHRRHEDRAGVIVFGRDPAIEIPPFDDRVQVPSPPESALDADHTNIAAALKLAQASFPEDSARRIVIVSDGNENLGRVMESAQAAVEAGVGIDVVPVAYAARAEVAVEKLAMPADIRRGQPFDLRIVLNNFTTSRAGDDGVVKGKLVVSQRIDERTVILSEQAVELPPGKRVFTLRQQIDDPNFYTYEARFVPDDAGQDTLDENNRATGFTHIRGSGQVLVIEDVDHKGQHQRLVDLLRKDNLEVAVRASDQSFTTLPDLQPFDVVILANVPREQFSDQQIAMLANNTHELGAGLMMLGGANSFGAGGWTSTEVEKALPVDCQIKSAKVKPRGALALLMHASEMADGNHWQKVIAKQAVQALGEDDYCGVLHWNGNDQWLWSGGLSRVDRVGRERMLGAIERMLPGDMPDFDPGMIKAQRAFAALTDAAVKHMVIISDGDPRPPSAGVINGLKAGNVTVSTVAVGTHGPAESAVMKDLANRTGGKYYEVKDPRALPKIYQHETRRVARPLIYEYEQGFQPSIKYPHEIVAGLPRDLPRLTGFVMTTLKENPLVEVSIVSPVPDVEENTTILAGWTYGLGKSVAFTTDAGSRWAKQWTEWSGYDKLFSQMVRWTMRPVGDEGKFSIATDVVDGRVNVVVTALDKEDEFLNFLDLGGGVIDPNLERRPLRLKQTAPGRYTGSFEASDAGSYFMTLGTAGKSSLRTGVNVPYSAEFRDREANVALLEQLAALHTTAGQAGVVIRNLAGGNELDELLQTNTFRHDLPPARRTQDAWPVLLVVAATVFLGDVFTRRVHVSFDWLWPLLVRVRDFALRRQRAAPKAEYLERLRSRKAEVTQAVEQQRSGTRFEPTPDAPLAPPPEVAPPSIITPPPPKPATGLAPEKPADEVSYTERLLKAKRKAQDDQK